MLTVTPRQLTKLLLNVAPTRPVFSWGPPGIGKTALVEQFAHDVGIPCLSLLGSQLAPEDLIGVPRIEGNRSQDQAIVKPMSSALVNRMLHVELKPSLRDWLDWAYATGIHEWVLHYV